MSRLLSSHKMHSAQYPTGCAGFTLLELLLGVSIFAIVMVSVYNTFSGAMRLNEQAQVISRTHREANWSLDKMVEDLENMVNFDFSGSDPNKAAFTGSSDTVELIVPTNEGLKAVRYSLQGAEVKGVHKVIIGQHTKKNVKVDVNKTVADLRMTNLLREEKSFAAAANNDAQDEGSGVEILSSHVQEKSLKFSYAYQEGEGENTQIVWKDTWSDKVIPGGVRIEMTFLSPDEKQEPLSVVREALVPAGSWGKSQ